MNNFDKNITETKILHVPILNLQTAEDEFEKIKKVGQFGAIAEINEINWLEKFPKNLHTDVYVSHDNETLFLLYRVYGERIKAAFTQDFDPVWKDSCVEFFSQRDGEKVYRNIECNILGAILFSERENRNSSKNLIEDATAICRQTQIKHKYEGYTQTADWIAFLQIPKQVIGFKKEERLSKQILKANFYKCGDETPEPHYLSWNKIDLPKPDFHVPQFFGILQFE